MAEVLERSIGVERVEVSGDNWRMIHNDCVEEVRRWPDSNDGRLDRDVSIPFSNHYEYTRRRTMILVIPKATRSSSRRWTTSHPRSCVCSGQAASPPCTSKTGWSSATVTGLGLAYDRPVPRRVHHALPPSRLRFLRYDPRQHRRRAREQRHLSARLHRDAEGLDQDGRRLPGIRPAAAQAAERQGQGLCGRAGREGARDVFPRPLADRRPRVLAIVRRPLPDAGGMGRAADGRARQAVHPGVCRRALRP